MFKTTLRSCLPPLMLLLLSQCLAQQETASPWQTPASEFVQAVLARAGSPAAITVSFENVSTLSNADYDALKKLLLADFRNSGVRLVKADFSQMEVQITLSEDWQSYVWVANIRQGTGSQLVIKKVVRQQKVSTPRAPTLTIKRTLVWQQEAPILDFWHSRKT